MKRLTHISLLLRRWHKQLGIFAALFFLFLASTGLLLNHGDLIGLDQASTKAPWLMHWYGLKTEVPAEGFHIGGRLSAFSDQTWVVGGKAVKAGHGIPLGVTAVDGNDWVATPGAIAIYQGDGQLVDRMELEALPALPIRRLGQHAGNVVIDTAHGAYESNDGLNWNATRVSSAVVWSQATQLSNADKAALETAFAPSLPALRIVSDLHSGQIWGRYGKLATDTIAAALLLLAFSGAWIYLRSSALRRAHSEHMVQAQQQRKQNHRPHLVRSAQGHRHGAEQGRNPER